MEEMLASRSVQMVEVVEPAVGILGLGLVPIDLSSS
jgi:hypothetical protein